ncbi:MAG: toll/interleukin-1 receptor domain-containing protein [Bacteroidota bacterium]
MEEGNVFISYSRKDRKKVDWISRQLVAAGFEIWIDRHDIPGGVEWNESITTAIIDAPAFILILSPNSIESEEVQKELDLAIESGKKIIPLILHPIDLDWLTKKNIDKFQNIVYYRRRQASIVDLVNSMGGLRGTAALMPEKTNLVLRENTRLIAELIRLIQEVSFQGGILIFNGGEAWQYYIQFIVGRDSPEVYGETVGNANLEKEDQLSEEGISALFDLGWKKPSKTSSGNYWQKWQVHTDRDRATVAVLTMNTFLKIYRHYRGEQLKITQIDLD